MKWLEIISVDVPEPRNRKRIIELCNQVSVPQSAELTVYWISSGKELSIHIQWKSQAAPEGGMSRLGCELSRTISDHGFVTHTLWHEYNHENS